jgi:serine/threonine protein kinase
MDRYFRQKVLGSGSFAQAWLVKEIATQKELVMKEVFVRRGQDIQPFLKEGDIMASIRHPNIIE